MRFIYTKFRDWFDIGYHASLFALLLIWAVLSGKRGDWLFEAPHIGRDS